MSRILVLILLFVLFYQVSRMFLNLFRAPERGAKPNPDNKRKSDAKDSSSYKGYKGGEYIDFEEVD